MTRKQVYGLLFLFILLVFAGMFLGETFLSGSLADLAGEDLAPSGIWLFLVINLNIVIVMYLGFLVVRNFVRLILDRRRNLLGSKLRTRLVVAFVTMVFFPTALLFLIARGIIATVVQDWFSPQVSNTVDNSVAVARAFYDTGEKRLTGQLLPISEEISNSFSG